MPRPLRHCMICVVRGTPVAWGMPAFLRAMIVPLIAFAALVFLAVFLTIFGFAYLTKMPELSRRRPLAPLTPNEIEIRDSLRAHVRTLAYEIGGRDAVKYDNLRRAAAYIEAELQRLGYATERQSYQLEGLTFDNIEAHLDGRHDPKKIVVVGAHYDTAGGLPGADDNGSGVAATLELARAFSHHPQARSIRWLFFVNEEPPCFLSPAMGSLIYARRCRDRSDDIVAMFSLETIGYYSDEDGSQHYPAGLEALGAMLPDRGDFLGFVANIRSAALLRRAVGSFRRGTSLPAEGAALPAVIPGVGWSDHWSFWQAGYPAVMVTDTAPYRYPWYHTAWDTPEKLDYGRMARAVTGLAAVICEIASP